jgi:hypothetical protein
MLFSVMQHTLGMELGGAFDQETATTQSDRKTYLWSDPPAMLRGRPVLTQRSCAWKPPVRCALPITLFPTTTCKCTRPLMRLRARLGGIIALPCDAAAYMGLTEFSYNRVWDPYRTWYTFVAYLGCLQVENFGDFFFV